MIKRAYFFIYYLLLFLIALATTVIIIASHPQTTRYLTQKLLKENQIGYSKIEGSLLSGITLYDIDYAGAATVKRLKVEYNLLALLNPTPLIKTINVQGITVILKNLPQTDESDGEFSMIPFAVSQLQLNDTHIILDDEELSFDLHASKINYRNRLTVKKLFVKLASSYGVVEINGSIKKDEFYSSAAFAPAPSLSKEYLSLLKGLPQPLIFDLDATTQSLLIRAHFDELSLEDDPNLRLNQADIDLTYFIESSYLAVDAAYFLSYGGFETQIRQKANVSLDATYTSELNATITRHPMELPFETFSVQVCGDAHALKGSLNAGPLVFDVEGKEYKQFLIHAQSKALALSFLSNLPDVLKKNIISFKADTAIELSPFSINGSFDTEGLYSSVEGSYTINKKGQFYTATLNPKLEASIWQGFPMQILSPFKFTYSSVKETGVLKLDANLLKFTLRKKDNTLNAWGNLGSADFKAYGRISSDTEEKIDFATHIPSVNAFLCEFGYADPKEEVLFDAEVDLNTTLVLSEKVKMKSRINLPWYILKADSQTSYKGENLYLESTLIDKELSVDRYSLHVMNQNIYSERASKISFDTNGTISLKEFWIYDNLLLTGFVNPVQRQGNLLLHSDKFNYESKEGNLTLKTDLNATFKDTTLNIEGTITLLDGVITYAPAKEYSISDDIIIIQDIKPYTSSKNSMHIHINAAKPVSYRTKEIDIQIIPDLVLSQEPDSALSVLGMITITEGEVSGAGKLFEFDKSELYFNGVYPINPHLNLNLHHHTLDYIDIEIFVTNTLSSPVIILTSKPAMSQNDIMSYLLFGDTSASVFDNSQESKGTAAVSSLLLATGLKQIVNDTAGVNIDTLNILTNEEGTLGYEIGTRFNKDMRIVYKNDTASSVILQYSLSRSVRIDVDVHETGQGVSILYIKDFKP